METAGNRVWSPAWEHGCVSMGVYRTELPGTAPLQGLSPSHPHPHPHPHPNPHIHPPPCNCRHPRFCQASHSRVFFGEADFFSAKRLFFRAARDVSGAHSEPPWARVEIKLKTHFQALSHSPSHERALALTSPPPDFLFSSIPQCPHPHIPTKSLIHPPG